MNGFANANSSATPTPIIATASSSATTRNICVRSIGASSGWRAAPSRNRPPRRPMPSATPIAPKPIMIATAIAVIPITKSISLSSEISSASRKPRPDRRGLSMRLRSSLVSLAQIDDREHHEDKRLKRDDQDVENRPSEMQRKLVQAEQRDQDEDQLAGIHVAEESQRQRQRLREQRSAFENEVERDDERRADDADALRRRRERMHRQLGDEAARALRLDRVVDDQEEHRQRHRERDVDVGRRHDLEVLDAGEARETRDPVDRDQIHVVHEEDPDEDRERERREHLVVDVERVLNGGSDESDERFKRSVK